MWPLYAMDTSFYNSLGSYELDVRCEMLRELGYDGTYLTLTGDRTWDDLSRFAALAREHDLAVAGVWANIDLGAGEDGEPNRRLLQSASQFAGIPRLELAVGHAGRPDARYDPASDGEARALIEKLVARLPDGVEICLYIHVDAWLERFGDAIELCRRIGDDRVGLCFPAYHWYAVDGAALEQLLTDAGGKLRSVNICGTRRNPNGGHPAIEPLDEGELDNFALLGLLQRLGYRGMIGVQGYSVGGDPYGKLRRTLAAFRDLTQRLAEHPQWAELRPPPPPR